MIVKLYNIRSGVSTMILPSEGEGRYELTYKAVGGELRRLIDIEGKDNKWIMVSNELADIVVTQDGKRQKIARRQIEPMSTFQIYDRKTDQIFTLFAQTETDDRARFVKYTLPSRNVTIGREGCDITYPCPYVSGHHAVVEINSQSLVIKDLGSTNGLYINGKPVKEKELEPGDMLELFGLCVVFLGGTIAINNPDQMVKLNDSFVVYLPKHSAIDEKETERARIVSPVKVFDRSPRVRQEIVPLNINVEGPGQKETREGMPAVLAMGTSLTMGVTSLMTATMAIQNAQNAGRGWTSAWPSLIMSVSMMTGSLLFPSLSRRYENKRQASREVKRHNLYMQYLERTQKSIEEQMERQKQILLETYPSTIELSGMIRTADRRLWERGLDHDDFLTVRLGLGKRSMQGEITFPQKGFTIDEDDLREKLEDMQNAPRVIRNAPVTFSLKENDTLGIIGELGERNRYAQSLLIQICAAHSYDEVKLVLIYKAGEEAQWEYARWFPHCWEDDRSFRLIASTTDEIRVLSSHLQGVLYNDSDDAGKKQKIHYVVLSTDKSLLDRCSALSPSSRDDKKAPVSIIALGKSVRKLPKECQSILNVRSGQAVLYERVKDMSRIAEVKLDKLPAEPIRSLATSMTNLHLTDFEEKHEMPDMISLLEMFHCGRIEHLNVQSRWKESNPIISLSVPVGVDSFGDLFELDIHQNAHGSHGLIAGTTGSGKSEFIITYLLSMAIHFNPLEVGFILIDYKGGGMSDTLKRLPHVVGIIDNLGGRQGIHRSMVSLQSELSRRQRVFKHVSETMNVSNLDIHKYQSLYRERAVKEPMQHLIIVSDEFAELKQQEPDFMDQLISAARIGRSLGVHLILATQKPAGVVNDQIWSNSRFRVCLKVQERDDSMDVIKKPDAALLTQTGRFYMQVGFDEIFALGQSAWSGAAYVEQDHFVKAKDESVEVINNLGQVTSRQKVKPDVAKDIKSKPQKQVDSVIEHVANVARRSGLIPEPLWKPMLPADLHMDDLETYISQEPKNDDITAIIGLVDDPANQNQFALTIPFTKEGNALLYGAAGSGEDEFVNAVIYSLCTRYTPEQIHIYSLDFASESTRMFAKMPHVGDVITKDDSEKVANFTKMIDNEMDRRRALFASYGGTIESYMKASKKTIASILVIIENYTAFSEIYENVEDDYYRFSREGLRFGIYFLVTATSTNAIRFRMTQNFKQLFCMQMNDPTEYMLILGKTDGVTPMNRKGSGIYRQEQVLEFQIAQFAARRAEDASQGEYTSDFEQMDRFSASIAAQYPLSGANRIKVLPQIVTIPFVTESPENVSLSAVPIGVEKESMDILEMDLTKHFVNLVLSSSLEDCAFLQGLCELLAADGNRRVIVIDSTQQFVVDRSRHYKLVTRIPDIESEIADIFSQTVTRVNSIHDAEMNGLQSPTYAPIILVLNNYCELCDRLTEDRKDKLSLVLEKGTVAAGMFVIIAQTAQRASAITTQSWFSAQASVTDGLWLGEGLADQFILQVSSKRIGLELSGDFGYLITRGHPQVFKMLVSEQVSSRRRR